MVAVQMDETRDKFELEECWKAEKKAEQGGWCGKVSTGNDISPVMCLEGAVLSQDVYFYISNIKVTTS